MPFKSNNEPINTGPRTKSITKLAMSTDNTCANEWAIAFCRKVKQPKVLFWGGFVRGVEAFTE